MDRVNELRLIPAHAAQQRNYKTEDFDLLERVCSLLEERIGQFDYEAVERLDDA